MTSLLLTRHGHVEGITPQRFRGRRDLELTPQGLSEAKRLAARIASDAAPAVIVCSPLRRCVATAQAISSACGVDWRPLEALNDIDYGDWQFQTHDDMKGQYPDLYDTWLSAPDLMRFPGGESLQDVGARTADAMRHILSRYADKTVVAVAHDSVNRVLLCQWLGLPLTAYWRFAQRPCCINEMKLGGRSATLIRMNDTCHIDSEGTLEPASA